MEFNPQVFLGLFGEAFQYWWVMIPAILLGIVVGAVPGFNASNTIIILLPVALAMPVEIGFVFMIALYCATHLGGGATAILINIPGNGGAAATVLDGYPMARKGLGQQALSISFTASVIGGLFTTILAVLAMPWFAEVAFYLHSVEMIVIMLLGISLIATIAAHDTMKGLVAGFFGLMLGAVGADHVYETPRGTFGFLELYDGMPLIPALIGLFAISEAFIIITEKSILSDEGMKAMRAAGWRSSIEGVIETLKRWWHVLWTSFIGLIIGVIPGAGASIAAFVAYQQSKTYSKTPELYGTGHIEGLIAPESANNGVTSGTLVPLVILGIPGGETAAVMMVVLQYHGINMGAELFLNNPKLAYLPFTSMTVAYILMLVTILPLTRIMSRVTVVSTSYLAPVIIAFTLVGAFVARDYAFDMMLAIVFGIIGYIARKTGYHVAAILIGVILGPLLESYFIRAMKISDGDISILFSSTLGNILWIGLVLNIAVPLWLEKRRARRRAHAG
jgi:putative tricarboxylic transport membrane protein